jgi:hypothetical protein
VAQQSRTGTALQDQRQCCSCQEQVSTADICVTRSVNSVRRDKLRQQIGYLLVLSNLHYWLVVCVRIGGQFSEGKHCARSVTRLLSISKMSA